MDSFHTAEKERGEPGILCRLTAMHELLGSHQVINGFCLYQVINNPSFIPGHRHLLGTPGHQRPLVVKWSSTIHRLYQVINNPSSIPGHQRSLVYTRGKRAIHTSGRGVGSASSADTFQRSDSWAACVCGAWASAIHAYGTILGSEFPPAVQSLGCPIS